MRRPRKRHRGIPACGLVPPRYSRAGSSAETFEKDVVTAAIGIKRLGLAVAALAAAGFGALAILSFLMPAETVRDAVKAEIRAVTGLEPVLRGDAAVSLFPTGTVRFDDVSLGDSRDRRAGAHRRARGRAAALLPVPDRPHRDRRRVAGASDHQHRASTPTAAPTGRATSRRSRAHLHAGRQARPRRSRKSGSRTAPSSCATRPTRSSRRSRTSISRWPGPRSPRASPPPGASPGTTSRSTPPSASPISSPR